LISKAGAEPSPSATPPPLRGRGIFLSSLSVRIPLHGRGGPRQRWGGYSPPTEGGTAQRWGGFRGTRISQGNTLPALRAPLPRRGIFLSFLSAQIPLQRRGGPRSGGEGSGGPESLRGKPSPPYGHPSTGGEFFSRPCRHKFPSMGGGDHEVVGRVRWLKKNWIPWAFVTVQIKLLARISPASVRSQ